MTWWQFVLPVALIACAVRLEALFVGPYWAWLELVPLEGGSDPTQKRERKLSLVRRITIPGVAGLLLCGIWPSVYSSVDASIVGLFGALVLVTPAILGELPWGIPPYRLAQIYGFLLVSFASAALVGGYVAGVANAKDGFWAFVQDSIIGLIVGSVVTAFATGASQRVSNKASEGRGM